MADSFYGGRPGFSCVIVLNYESIDEMVSYFQQGPDYEAVHFDEYVLINTKNHNHIDNGKIFRRSYDYTNEMGGAVYIGKILGPMGPSPMLEMTTLDEVVDMKPEEGYTYRFSEGEYAPLYNLVPGKGSDGTYHDSIKWACCSMRDESDLDTTAYIGFVFPYLVVDYDADSVSPYYNRDSQNAGFTNTDLIDRTDDESHPYWEQWHISVPKGIKGDTFENFRVITASSNDGVESYTGQSDDRNNSRQILVYDYYHYDKEEGGEPVTIYIGPYNMITGISVSDDGSITIEFTHDDDTVYAKKIKWINSVTLSDAGHFTVVYNNGDPNYETDLVWVREVSFAEDGVVTIIYNNGTTTEYPNIKWITNVGLDENGQFHIDFNNGDSYDTTISWVKEVSFAEDGTVTVTYSDGKTTQYPNIKWLTNVDINTGIGSTGEGTGNQKVHLTYNTGAEEDIGAPLNYIMKMSMVESDYHLLVWYSDPAKRQEIINNGQSYTLNGEDGWFDLGSVKDESGVLIGLNISLEDHPELVSIEEAIAYLNQLYPEGLIGVDLQGKVVTIGNENGNKLFYAFNYDTHSWYYVGSFDVDITTLYMIGAKTDEDIETKQNNLMAGGLWFESTPGDYFAYFAVYSADDSSLTFYGDSSVPDAGTQYNGKTATDVYTGVEDTGTSNPPWYNKYSTSIKVVFDKSFIRCRPKSCYYWFRGLSHDGEPDLRYLNTSECTSMSNMFRNCSGLTSLDVGNFDTSAVTNMTSMFYGCSGLTTLDVSNFDTSKVTTMSYMFYSCSSLTSLDVSNFDTSAVTNMLYMFYGCSSLTSLDMSNFDTSAVTNMVNMFRGCSGVTTIYSDDSKFVTTNVTSSGSMFTNCTKLVGGNGTAYDSSKVTADMAHVDTTSNPGYFTEKI